jgi:SAM-dependent methyltransferase
MANPSDPADTTSTTTLAPPLALERVVACPLCGSSDSVAWRANCRDWQQPQAPDRYSYERCTRCRAHFLATRPQQSELDRVYFAGYGPYREPPPTKSGGGIGSAVLRRLGRRLTRQAERTYTPERLGETLLDYGCGAPTFLDQAREKGFRTVGADFAEDVLEAVRAHGHEAFLVGEALKNGLPDESVGCVRMSHLVEHLYDPMDALGLVYRKLQPGGRVHISTPNPASLGSALFRRRWHGLHCPRHVVLYQPDVLKRLLREIGFRDISVIQEVGAKDLLRSWGIVLYDRGRIPHERIERLESGRASFASMLPLAVSAALMGRADRYHLFGRRG